MRQKRAVSALGFTGLEAAGQSEQSAEQHKKEEALSPQGRSLQRIGRKAKKEDRAVMWSERRGHPSPFFLLRHFRNGMYSSVQEPETCY